MQVLMRKAAVVLEDGTVFPGTAVGAPGVAAGEACFTTANTGYEEAATDPSYVAQVLCFAYPLVGNYGVDPARAESERVQAEAIVMRSARPEWAAWLREQGVVAIEDVDTRTLVRRIRSDGVLRCAVGDAPVEELHAGARPTNPIGSRPHDHDTGWGL
jgi:carbamoyl-phosphate synthase small subunit